MSMFFLNTKVNINIVFLLSKLILSIIKILQLYFYELDWCLVFIIVKVMDGNPYPDLPDSARVGINVPLVEQYGEVVLEPAKGEYNVA